MVLKYEEIVAGLTGPSRRSFLPPRRIDLLECPPPGRGAQEHERLSRKRRLNAEARERERADAERYAAHRERVTAWQKAHPERMREYDKRWKAKNRDAIRVYQRTYARLRRVRLRALKKGTP